MLIDDNQYNLAFSVIIYICDISCKILISSNQIAVFLFMFGMKTTFCINMNEGWSVSYWTNQRIIHLWSNNKNEQHSEDFWKFWYSIINKLFKCIISCCLLLYLEEMPDYDLWNSIICETLLLLLHKGSLWNNRQLTSIYNLSTTSINYL